MKTWIYLLLAVGILGASSCSNEFDLTTEWKDIPIVYGLINPDDTAHYVRVEKAFLDPVTSALITAQIADSLYYMDATVQFQIEGNANVYNLERVDGNLEGYEREEGIFANAPNYLYKIHSNDINLEAGDILNIIIQRGDDKDLVTATTTILGEMDFTLPASLINFEYDRDTRIQWLHDAFSQLYDVALYIERSGGFFTSI